MYAHRKEAAGGLFVFVLLVFAIGKAVLLAAAWIR